MASKLALFTPEVTVTDAGTVTAVLLLDRVTADPLLSAGVFSVTVQTSAPDPVIDPSAHVSSLMIATPCPDRVILRIRPSEEVFANANSPVDAPAAEGSNWRLTVAVSPGFRVRGNVAPEAAKPAPLSVAALTVTGAVPVDDRVTACVAEALTSTSPKSKLPALTLRTEVTAFNCSANVSALLPTFAVRIAVCVDVTGETTAVKLAPVAPAGTATVEGTTTAPSLLLKSTVTPLAPAAALRLTEHESEIEPVADPLAQLSELRVAVVATAAPVPVRLTTIELPEDALLVMVNWPVAAPVAFGSN